jgi:hypothetical protein
MAGAESNRVDGDANNDCRPTLSSLIPIVFSVAQCPVSFCEACRNFGVKES